MLVTPATWSTDLSPEKVLAFGLTQPEGKRICLPTLYSWLFLGALIKLFRTPQGLLHFDGISCNLVLINWLHWIFLSTFVGGFQGIFLELIWLTGANSLSSQVMESALSFKTLKQRHLDKDGWDKIYSTTKVMLQTEKEKTLGQNLYRHRVGSGQYLNPKRQMCDSERGLLFYLTRQHVFIVFKAVD